MNWHQKHVETGFYPPVTYLLIDDLDVARKEGVCRVMNRPERVPEPVLPRDRPWEVGTDMRFLPGASFYDPEEKLFKLYYLVQDPAFREEHPDLKWDQRVAYAVSPDCRTWEKPELGLVEWGGSKANNLVALPYPSGGAPLENVFKNPLDEGDGARYLALCMERHVKQPGERSVVFPGGPPESENPLACGQFLYESPDGFTWTRRGSKQLSNAIVMDGLNMHGYDEELQAWILWPRARYQPTPSQKYRTIGVSITRDLERIPYPRMALAPDEDDPPGVDFDRMMTIKVPGGYVGLVRVGRYIVDPVKGKTEFPHVCQLAFSRDARAWSRPAGRDAYLACGPKGSWDDHSVLPANPIQVGDDIYILVSANTVTHDGRIGLHTLKRDRWVAIEPNSAMPGVLETRPTYFAGPILRVNADARGGALRAEIVDVLTGQPLPGHSVAEADPFTGDALDHPCAWKGRSDIPASLIGEAYSEGLPGRVLAIRFHLDHARLFSFSC